MPRHVQALVSLVSPNIPTKVGQFLFRISISILLVSFAATNPATNSNPFEFMSNRIWSAQEEARKATSHGQD